MRAQGRFAVVGLGLALILSPEVAGAKDLKPPRALCLDFDSGGGELLGALAIKSVGKVETAAGKSAFYQIAGELVFPTGNVSGFPVAGAGHVAGTVFHFAITGQTVSVAYGGLTSFHVEGAWDLMAQTGTTSGHLMVADGVGGVGANETLAMGLVAIDCATVAPPY